VGLKDRMIAKAMANLPDYRAALTALLGHGDQVRAFAFSNHMAQKGNDGVTDLTWMTGFKLSHVLNLATTVYNGKKHVGGAEGSDARSISRKAAYPMLAIGERTFSVWNLGADGTDLPPVCYARFGLDRIKSITDIGPAKSIRHPMRVAFRDDSFIDFTVYDAGPLTTPDKFGDFFAAARSVNPPPADHHNW
jgi:hypothetical protein